MPQSLLLANLTVLLPLLIVNMRSDTTYLLNAFQIALEAIVSINILNSEQTTRL